MKKSPNYIKKTLDEVRAELLKDKKLQLSRQLYVQKLKEIFSKQIIDLKDELKTKLSSTGTDKSIAITSSDNTSSTNVSKKASKNNQKVIFLNNEILDQKANDIDEANNELFYNNENIIELKDEIQDEKNQKIIELIEEVDQIINLTDEVAETVVASSENTTDEISPPFHPSSEIENISSYESDVTDDEEILNADDNTDSKTQEQSKETEYTSIPDELDIENDSTPEEEPEYTSVESDVDKEKEEILTTEQPANNENTQEETDRSNIFSNDQIDYLSSKINDLDLSSSELTEKLDELLDQKNLFSEKFNDELDIKLTEALNRSEENLEGKINNINDSYHQEFQKYEEETNKNFANLEDQIGQLNEQLDKISDLQDYNLKIENSLNNLNNKIEETLEKISLYKNETTEKFNEINQKIQNMEPELVNKIIEKERNKSESEKLQDKFDQMSKIMDMQNMRMLQMYHSSELQHSHSILKQNLETKNTKAENKVNTEIFSDELKKEVFPKIQKEMDKQFNLLKEQLSEYEIKSVLDKIGSTDLNKEFKKPTKKFANLFDAKKYVKNSISKKSRDWIKNNDVAIDEIAKKLLDK